MLVLALTVVPSALAQPGGNQVDEIRAQIESLQKQLQAIENQPLTKRHVTQIGSSRIRGRNADLSVRIYDLGDLFALAPPYGATRQSDLSKNSESIFPAAPGGHSGFGGLGGGGGYFSLGPATLHPPRGSDRALNQMSGSSVAVSTSQTELIMTIKKTISPEIWDDMGGPASIARLGNAFIISADDEAHEQIDALLNLFRKRWGTLRTVSVRAWWHWMSPSEIGPILDANGDEAEDDIAAFGLVADEAWQALLKARREPEGERTPGFQATVTCYNGQTVHTISGDQSLAVSDVRTIVTENENGEKSGQIGYRPVVSLIQEGVAFQVTPISNVSGRTVLLDVHSRVLLPGDAEPEQLKELVAQAGEQLPPAEIVKVIDKRRFGVSQLSTTVRVPVNRPMLVGGMSWPGKADSNLYLFVKVSVQELRNDQEDEPPVEEEAVDNLAGEDGTDSGDSETESAP